MDKVKETFSKVQELLDSLQGEKVTFLFIEDSSNRFIISGTPVNIMAQILFAMCRYPVVRDIIKACADKFDKVNDRCGDIARGVTMDHLIEQNAGTDNAN